MPRLDKAITLRLIDVEFGISAARQRGERPPNGVKLLAEKTGIDRCVLANVVHCGDQVADYRIGLIAEALGVKPQTITAAEDEKEQPKEEPVAPPKRAEKKSGTGPKRARGVAA